MPFVWCFLYTPTDQAPDVDREWLRKNFTDNIDEPLLERKKARLIRMLEDNDETLEDYIR